MVANTGAVTIQGILGRTTITATKAADTNYNEATASYTLSVLNDLNDLILKIKVFLEGAQ